MPTAGGTTRSNSQIGRSGKYGERIAVRKTWTPFLATREEGPRTQTRYLQMPQGQLAPLQAASAPHRHAAEQRRTGTENQGTQQSPVHRRADQGDAAKHHRDITRDKADLARDQADIRSDRKDIQADRRYLPEDRADLR